MWDFMAALFEPEPERERELQHSAQPRVGSARASAATVQRMKPLRRIVAPDACAVREASDVGAARRLARRLAAEIEAPLAEPAALIATELATNLIDHAEGGILQIFGDGERLTLLAVDRGGRAGRRSPRGVPGLGAGLRTVEGLSQRFLLRREASGTIVESVLAPAGPAPAGLSPSGPEVGLCLAPHPGLARSGDGIYFLEGEGGWSAVIFDVLGHGPKAAEDRDRALEVLGDRTLADPEGLVAALGEAMRGRRGAALRWARYERAQGSLRTFGIGNVDGLWISGASRRTLRSQPGIVGRSPVRPQVQELSWGPGCELILFTDGVSSRSSRELKTLSRGTPLPLPEEAKPSDGKRGRRSAGLRAARLYRDAARPRDDVAILALTQAEGTTESTGDAG